MTTDPYAPFKAAQREGWASFAPLAMFTTPPAAALVAYAGLRGGETLLDVACGTGVVAVTAARAGATVSGLDLSPVLLEDARRNAAVIGAAVEFREGDVEALPYADASFDVVVSQFGHMFAPRPGVAIAEMLRVLKPGGRIAFSTWPPELVIGACFDLVGRYLPPPPGAAAPSAWGDPTIVRARLGDAVREIEFACDEMVIPALSPRHYALNMEHTAAPVMKVVEKLGDQPQALAGFRAELEKLVTRFFAGNRIRQTFLMTRAFMR